LPVAAHPDTLPSMYSEAGAATCFAKRKHVVARNCLLGRAGLDGHAPRQDIAGFYLDMLADEMLTISIKVRNAHTHLRWSVEERLVVTR
jgi:hypothetical protein